MLTLYYSPGACSLAPHIALEEAGAQFELACFPTAERATFTPEFLAINPRGRVPVLTTGTATITENIAILGHIARLHPEAGLLPDDDLERLARCYELLSLFAGGVHIAFAQIWRPERFLAGEGCAAELEAGGRAKVLTWFAEIEGLLTGSGYIDGRGYTLCDAYPLVFFRWGVRLGFDMSPYPGWNRHVAMMLARPAVQRVMARENIVIG